MNANHEANQIASVDDIAAEARKVLTHLLNAVRMGRGTYEMFATSRRLIAALPLTTRGFALLDVRICNARRYYAEGELGAAAYELGLAERSLAP
jgi:hypothetical protein